MSRLEELIQQYCPDGVEYRSLGDVCIFADGFPLKADDIKGQGIYPVVKIGNINNWVVDAQDCYLTSLPSKVKTSQILSGGEILVGMSGSTGKTGYSVLQNAIVNQRIAIIRNNDLVLNGYLKHSLVNNNFESYCFQKGTGPQHNISKFDLLSYKIPVPPLPVQEEIVRILDAFTELQAELQAELQKRKQQYNYYLDNLLSFNSEGQAEVRWMKLKDVATQWYRGAGIKREEVSEDGMPCIRYGEIHTTYNIWFDDCISHTDESKQVSRKYAEKGDILFAITSEDIPFVGNSVAYLGDERILVGGDIVVMKHNQDPKYMAYALSTSDAIKQKGKGKVKSKVVHTNVPSLQEIVIPIPSMTEQKRIASILDRFDTLTNDLTSGLPAEIEKRRQQYEYYRDKLLTFKRKEA